MKTVLEYVTCNPSYKEVFSPHLTPISNEKLYEAIYQVTTRLPLEIMHTIGKMPYIGSKQQVE